MFEVCEACGIFICLFEAMGDGVDAVVSGDSKCVELIWTLADASDGCE